MKLPEKLKVKHPGSSIKHMRTAHARAYKFILLRNKNMNLCGSFEAFCYIDVSMYLVLYQSPGFKRMITNKNLILIPI